MNNNYQYDAIYCRQSIDKKDSLSLDAQAEICRKFSSGKTKIFADRGYSGKNTNRPAFQELIGAVNNGHVKKIIVYRLDRFSRSIADFSRIWELLSKHNVEFISATENFDTSSPMGRAMLNIVQVFAQLERETTAERVKDNYAHRFNLGSWTGGPAPFAFDIVKTSVDNQKVSTLAKNERAEIVKYIFEEYAKPYTSLGSLAKDLNNKGIPAPKREVWDSVSLSRILHSPLYARATQDVYFHYLSKGMQIKQPPEAFDGIHACQIIGRRDRTKNKYNDLKDQMLAITLHEGFIDADLWLNVQDKLSRNKQLSRSKAGNHTWLTGLMKCAKCGYALKVNYVKKENRYYLVCSGKSNFAICDCRISVNLRELEDYIANEIQSMLEEAPPDDMPTTKSFSSDILAIEQKIDRLVNALSESSEVTVSYISKQIDALHKEREELLSRSKTQPNKTMRSINFNALSFDEKKVVAAEFIDRINIEGINVNIVWKI